MTAWDWVKASDPIALWVEGIALVLIFIWDRIDANRGHQETIAQLKIAQDQIKISQNAERAWLMTELAWPGGELKVVTGASRQGDEPQVETTTVTVKLTCRNDRRSPAWVDTIQGYCEIVEGRLKNLPSPIGHKAEPASCVLARSVRALSADQPPSERQDTARRLSGHATERD